MFANAAALNDYEEELEDEKAAQVVPAPPPAVSEEEDNLADATSAMVKGAKKGGARKRKAAGENKSRVRKPRAQKPKKQSEEDDGEPNEDKVVKKKKKRAPKQKVSDDGIHADVEPGDDTDLEREEDESTDGFSPPAVVRPVKREAAGDENEAQSNAGEAVDSSARGGRSRRARPTVNYAHIAFTLNENGVRVPAYVEDSMYEAE
jgi:hypothetical protein